MPDLRAALLIQWIPHPLRACPQFWSFTTSKLIHAINVLGNPAIIAYQQDMDAVNRFCSFNRLPPKLKRELRRYMYNTKTGTMLSYEPPFPAPTYDYDTR